MEIKFQPRLGKGRVILYRRNKDGRYEEAGEYSCPEAAHRAAKLDYEETEAQRYLVSRVKLTGAAGQLLNPATCSSPSSPCSDESHGSRWT